MKSLKLQLKARPVSRWHTGIYGVKNWPRKRLWVLLLILAAEIGVLAWQGFSGFPVVGRPEELVVSDEGEFLFETVKTDVFKALFGSRIDASRHILRFEREGTAIELSLQGDPLENPGFGQITPEQPPDTLETLTPSSPPPSSRLAKLQAEAEAKLDAETGKISTPASQVLGEIESQLEDLGSTLATISSELEQIRAESAQIEEETQSLTGQTFRAFEDGQEAVRTDDILPGLDIIQQAIDKGVRQKIIYKTLPQTPQLRFEANLEKLIANQGDDGSWNLLDENGRSLLSIASPLVEDATGEQGLVSVEISADAQYSGFDFVQGEQPPTYSLVLSPDEEWFYSPDRVYPITLKFDLLAVLLGLTFEKNTFTAQEEVVFHLEYWPDEGEVKPDSIVAILVNGRGGESVLNPTIEKLAEGMLKLRLPVKRNFRPGRHTLKLEYEQAGKKKSLEQDFSWGVLAINTDKSIYLPGESAYLQMAVLDDLGGTVCDANLKLKVKSLPAGKAGPKLKVDEFSTDDGTIQYSPECGPTTVTNTPDYFAYYQVGDPGTYQLELTATTINGEYTIQDSFEVKESVSFEVSREGPTRIYPYSPYTMRLAVKANQDFSGEIKEYLPEGFGFTSQEGLKPSQEGNSKTLSWEVNLASGQTAELAYEFDAPDESPQFYLLGPLELITDHRSPITIFSETRRWQIAADAPGPTIEQQINIIDQQASHLWYNTSWTRRQPVTITNSTSSVFTNFQVKLDVTYDADMQTDFDDLRFTNSSNTLLDHWTETYTASTDADVWVEVDTIPANSTATIYMYYGNATVGSGSNGSNTFLFFDDFNDGDASGWTPTSLDRLGSWAVTSNEYVQSDTADGWALSVNSNTISDGILEAKVKQASGNDGGIGVDGRYADTSNFYHADILGGQVRLYKRISASWAQLQTATFSWSGGTWYTLALKMNGSTLYACANSTCTAAGSDSNLTSGNIVISSHKGVHHFDDIRVRQYAATEPSSSFGTEAAISDYLPTDNGLGRIEFDPTKFSGETVYFEVVRSLDGTTWTRSISSSVSMPAAAKDFTVRMRVGDGSSQLPTAQLYNITDGSSTSTVTFGAVTDTTVYLKAARLIIVQTDASSITDSQTQIEVGDEQTVTNTSYSPLTDKKIYRYTSSTYDPSPSTYFETSLRSGGGLIGTRKIEQQINIIDQNFTTSSTSYVPTDNSLGLIRWTSGSYTGATVYFEAVLSSDSICGGANNDIFVALFTEAGSQVTGTAMGRDGTLPIKARSGDITSNLVDGTNYTASVRGGCGITVHMRAARLIIVQSNPTKLDGTETQVELGDNENTTQTSATQLTDKKIWNYDSSKFSPSPSAYFEATLRSPDPKIQQQINIIDQVYTTSSTSYNPSDNSLGLVRWTAGNYTGASVYFEAVLSSDSICGGANNDIFAALFTEGGSEVSGSGFGRDGTLAIRGRSGDISSNLVDGTNYTARVRGGCGITVHMRAARLIIVQTHATKLDDTATAIEVGNNQTGFTNTSYADLTDQKIYQYDQDQFTPTPETSPGDVEFHATLKIDDAGDSVYAELFNCGSPCNPASGQQVAEVSHNGSTSWTLKIATNVDADADWDTTNDDEYIVRIRCNDDNGGGCSGNIANAKIVLHQSDSTNGISAVEVTHQYINTLNTRAASSYAETDYDNLFNDDHQAIFEGMSGIAYYFEATMNTTTGGAVLAYAELRNVSDGNTPTNGEISSNSTSYTRVRSSSLTPTAYRLGGANYDTRIRNSGTDTTSVSTSWLVIQVSGLATSATTAYADLYECTNDDCSAGSALSGSEISQTSNSWTRCRAGGASCTDQSALTLTTGRNYVVRIKTSSGQAQIANAKIVLVQSDATNGIAAVEIVHQQINTLRTDTDANYTEQDYDNLFDPDNWGVGVFNYYFEATLNAASTTTAYAALYNDTDNDAINTPTTSEVSTTSTSYERKRSADLSDNTDWPSAAKDLDTILRNSTTNTTSASSSWLIIQASGLSTAATVYAALYEDGSSCTSQVSNSELSTSSTSWVRLRTASTISLTTGTDYMVCVKVTSGGVGYIANGKVIHNQSNAGGLTNIEIYHQYVNTKVSVIETRRKPIIITNNGSALTDYQVKLTVAYDTDMQSDFDDLRFTNASETLLDYWVETYTASTEATVWVEVDSIAANTTTTIYMYYGSSSLSSASSLEDTFRNAQIHLLTSRCPNTDANCNFTDSHTEFDTVVSNVENEVSGFTIDGTGYRTTVNDGANPFGNSNDYFSRYRYLFKADTTGTHDFGTNSDDASEVHQRDTGDTDSSHTVLAYWYGGHGGGTCGSSGTTGSLSLTSGDVIWIEYRHTEVGGGQLAQMCTREPGGSYQIVSTTNFSGQLFTRTITTEEEPSPSFGAEESISLDASYYNQFSPGNFDAGTFTYLFEATLKTPGGTGYARLWNTSDSSQIDERITSSTSYTRLRTPSGLSMPSTAKTLDTRLEVSIAASSWLIIQVESLGEVVSPTPGQRMWHGRWFSSGTEQPMEK